METAVQDSRTGWKWEPDREEWFRSWEFERGCIAVHVGEPYAGWWSWRLALMLSADALCLGTEKIGADRTEAATKAEAEREVGKLAAGLGWG